MPPNLNGNWTTTQHVQTLPNIIFILGTLRQPFFSLCISIRKCFSIPFTLTITQISYLSLFISINILIISRSRLIFFYLDFFKTRGKFCFFFLVPIPKFIRRQVTFFYYRLIRIRSLFTFKFRFFNVCAIFF